MDQKQTGLSGYHLCQSIKNGHVGTTSLDMSILSLNGFVSQEQYNLAVILYRSLTDQFTGNPNDKHLTAIEQWFLQLIEPPPSNIDLLDVWLDNQMRRCRCENRFRSKTHKRISVSIQLRIVLAQQLPYMKKAYEDQLRKLITN